jgi:dihydroorotate dehydrogenase
MGMPNVGVAAAAERLRRPRSKGTRVIAAVAGATPEEVVEAAATLAPLADGIEIGLVCRHSPETFEMAELPTVRTIIEGVMARRSGPVFIKIPPHHSPAERSRSLAIVDLCLSTGVDGVSVSGTSRVAEAGLSTGEGGLAGRATTPDALRILEDIAGRALGRLAIKAAGGVFSGADAYRFLSAGATTVEVYSAFIYRGWTVGRTLAAELAGELGRRHLGGVAAIGRRETVEPGGVSA